jgi:hypothetical protein
LPFAPFDLAAVLESENTGRSVGRDHPLHHDGLKPLRLPDALAVFVLDGLELVGARFVLFEAKRTLVQLVSYVHVGDELAVF